MRAKVYTDLNGREICLEHLDAHERNLLERVRRRARASADWDAFDNYWTRAVPALYEARGVERKQVAQTILWRIGQDLSSRLAITAGLVRPDDYQGDLEQLIRERYPSRRAFCEATGLGEDMLSHVLAGRKDFSIAALNEGLARVGYGLRIMPAPAFAAEMRARKRTG